MASVHKAKKSQLTVITPDNIDNKEDLERHIWIKKGRSKRQDLLSKLGAWKSREKVEGERKEGKGAKKNMYSSIKTIKKKPLLSMK